MSEGWNTLDDAPGRTDERPGDRHRRGEDVLIRRLRRGEEGLLRAHLLRLDPEARRRRFGAPVRDDFIRAYAEREPERGAAVEGAFVDGVLRGVGELRPINDEAAEVAFSVERGWQGRGLGARLMDRLLFLAGAHGVRLVTMLTTADNVAMQRLFRAFGGRLSRADGMVEGTVRTTWPTPFSTAQAAQVEATADAQSVLGGLAQPRRTPERAD